MKEVGPAKTTEFQIVFDANPLAHTTKSGVGYFTYGLIQALADISGVRLTGYYFNFLGRKKLADFPKGASVGYREIRFLPTKVINMLRRVGIELPIELFVRQKADALLFPNFITVPTLHSALRAVVVHDLSFVDCPEYVSARNRSFLQKWVPRHIKSADMVITISEFTKQRLMERYEVPAEKIRVTSIPPAEQSAVSDETLLDRYGLRRGYLLFVGNIEPRKNISGLLSAYEALPKGITDAYPLVLVGGRGWNDAEILAQLERIKRKGLRVVQTGYVSDAEKSAFFQHATVFIQPSHYEGFGMPLLEAMRNGLPVVCSDIPVFHEVADDAAMFFDPRSPAEITTVLTTLLGDAQMQKRLAEASRRRIVRYKTWPEVATEVIGWLRNDD